MKKLLYVLIASALFLGACASAPANEEAVEPKTEVEETKAKEEVMKAELIHDTPEVFESNMEGDYLLLDVRTKQEFSQGFIEGAILIPVDELESRLSEIEEYKGKRVLVYCRSGNRSVTASNILLENGFTEVHNLLTGINGWLEYKAG